MFPSNLQNYGKEGSPTYFACLTTAKLSDEKQHFTQWNQTCMKFCSSGDGV